MKYVLLLTNEAIEDIAQASEWYDSKKEELGNEFSEIALSYIEYLLTNAHSHPKVRGEYRELVMKRFPYVIIYRIIKEKEVVVLGVIHTKEHPSNRREKRKL